MSVGAEPYLRGDLTEVLSEERLLQWAETAQGEVFREVAGRRTLRVLLDGKHYFLKFHAGVGWLEIWKNWLVGRRPVLGAENEYLACRHLKRCGIKVPRVVAYAAAGRLASRRSVVVCDELAGYISLEDVLRRWHTSPPRPSASRRLLLAVAVFVRRLHEAGVAHRDLYVCHLLLHEKSWEDGRAELAVLDLHRARIFASLPHYWRRRDLAALLFSALDAPLHPRAWLGFVRIYSGRPLAEVFASDGRFWRSVYRRALKLYAKGLQRGIVAGNSCTDGKVANEVGTAAPSWKSLTRPRIQT